MELLALLSRMSQARLNYDTCPNIRITQCEMTQKNKYLASRQWVTFLIGRQITFKYNTQYLVRKILQEKNHPLRSVNRVRV